MTLDSPFQPAHFARVDESDDELFYVQPRLVTHIDDAAIAAVGRLYASILPAGGVILDLMSSWRSHLPPDFPVARLVGLGMNAVELRENNQLDSWVVKNINRAPTLPFESDVFDGCIVTVSIQYMTRPLETFREVRRVLKPGAPFIVTFSNRCFPTKAVAVWRSMSDEQHLHLVRTYFELSGDWHGLETVDAAPPAGDYSDPVYAVYARKPTALTGASPERGVEATT